MTQFTVKWFVANKEPQWIRFNEEDKTYKVDKTITNGTTYSKDETVEIEANGDIITSINKTVAKVSTPKEEPKQEAKVEKTKEPKPTEVEAEPEVKAEEPKKEDKIEIVEKYIHAVSGNREVAKFSQETPWVKIAESFRETCMEKGLVARNTCELKMVNGEIADVISVKESTQKEEKAATTKANKSSGGFRTPEEMKQSDALMCAKDIIVAMINNGREEVNSTTKIIEGLSKLTNTANELLK
jgi:hypothetical protein